MSEHVEIPSGGSGQEAEELKARKNTDEELSNRELMRQVLQSMRQLQAKVEALEQQQVKASVKRQSIGPFTAGSPLTEYSASAALPLPPVVAQPPRRQSYGMPLATSAAYTPSTPAAATRTARQVNWDDEEGTQEAEHGRPAESADSDSRRVVEHDKQWERASKALSSVIKSFYGQASKDNDNIIDWVEKVDTIFSIRMKDRPDGRLDLVRQMLAGTALKWMNRYVQELNEQLSRGEISGPVEWNLLRQPFIDAHLGVNTIETFKAELRMLRLGSTKCPTPVEFNKEFDHLVELAFPDRRLGTMSTVLGDEYAQIPLEAVRRCRRRGSRKSSS